MLAAGAGWWLAQRHSASLALAVNGAAPDVLQFGRLQLEPCSIGRTDIGVATARAYCTGFEVPEDHGHPDGRKIRLIEGPALESLGGLKGPFDFVFIDADKPGYAAYYDAVLPMLADSGLIAVDNVLWSGAVLDPKEDQAKAIVAFNEKIANDERVVQVIATVRDGVTLIRKR